MGMCNIYHGMDMKYCWVYKFSTQNKEGCWDSLILSNISAASPLQHIHQVLISVQLYSFKAVTCSPERTNGMAKQISPSRIFPMRTCIQGFHFLQLFCCNPFMLQAVLRSQCQSKIQREQGPSPHREGHDSMYVIISVILPCDKVSKLFSVLFTSWIYQTSLGPLLLLLCFVHFVESVSSFSLHYFVSVAFIHLREDVSEVVYIFEFWQW